MKRSFTIFTFGGIRHTRDQVVVAVFDVRALLVDPQRHQPTGTGTGICPGHFRAGKEAGSRFPHARGPR